MDYYKNMYDRYKVASDEKKLAGLNYWIEKHKENLINKRDDLIILSAKMIAIITLAIDEKKMEV